MAKPDNDYRLVIFDAPDDPQAVRDLLCAVTGIHPTDATRWVARTPGIWPRPLAEGETRELLDGLFELGVAAEAWRADRLPKLAPARTIHDAACLDQGLRIKGLRGEPIHWIPWDRIELICAGRVAGEGEARDPLAPGWSHGLSTGLSSMLGRRPPSLRRPRPAGRPPREATIEVILVRNEPLLALRAISDKMTYAYLGDRLRPSTAENFPLFVGDLCARATHATIAPTTRALLGEPGTAEFEFPSPNDLLDYATLRLLWGWYRRDRDAERKTLGD